MNTIVPGSGSSLRLADIAPEMRGAIAVYAASATDIDPVYYEAARELGALIAREGYALVDGGGAVGAYLRCARDAARSHARAQLLSRRLSGDSDPVCVDLRVGDR